ncbi:MAG: HTH domain-containing protein [Candidatus Aenigmarchaeota archaeon]|nr:HTH domain-containing protein [Candidatus Aenigmarchaeota archaeon]
MRENEAIKEEIIKVLDKHPEGLTFAGIARELNVHRHTLTKYIYELKGSGIIFVRDLGTLKLCYLKKRFLSEAKRKNLRKR